ncbi:endonuclease, partial [bacterium AM6]
GSLDSYLVTIADLEELLGASYVAINAPASLKNMLPSASWPLPSGCDLS